MSRRTRTLPGERSALWQSTVDTMDSAVLLLDHDATVLGANEKAHELAALNGELVGSNVKRLGANEIWPCVSELLATISESATVASRQVEERASGMTWDVVLRKVRGTSRSIALLRDVTNLVALESTARRNERVAEMGRLVANVAHEVRNPLFSMSATIDAMEARLGATEPLLTRYLDPLRRELRRMTALMQDLLEYGKPPLLDSSIVPLSDAVGDAVAAVADQLRAKEVTISNAVTPADGLVLVDRARIAQAFQNILENAIHHTPFGSTVAVRAARLEAGEKVWVACSFADQGPGFTESGLPKLFEPFYTTRPGGTGLGLSIVKRIVDIHGGRVFASNNDRGGARITVWLALRENA